jgi:hypothetical protein
VAASDAAGAQGLVDWGVARAERPVPVRGLTLRRAIVAERGGRRAEAAAAYAAEAERLETAGSPDLAAMYRRQAALALRAPGRAEAGGAAATSTTAPAALALGPARPNPFSDATEFELSLPEDTDVRVEAFDALGRRVATLAAGALAAGRHVLALDGAGLAPGLYVVRAVVGGDRTLTQRVTLLR